MLWSALERFDDSEDLDSAVDPKNLEQSGGLGYFVGL